MSDDEKKKVDDDVESVDYGSEETEVPHPMEQERSCRDIMCLLIFLGCWILWILLAAMAFTDGCPDSCNNPRKLIFGYDSSGCMCGQKCDDLLIDNRGKKRLYMPDPQQPTLRVCVAECPDDFAFDKDLALELGTFVCDAQCRIAPANFEAGNVSEFYLERDRGSVLTGLGAADNCFLPGSQAGDCWYPAYPTTEILYKCIPALPAELSEEDIATMAALGLPVENEAFSSALAVLANPGGEYGKMTAEFANTWPLVIFAVFIAVGLGFVFLLLIRLCAMPMMWFFVIGLLFVLATCTLFAWDRTGSLDLFKSKVSETVGQNITALVEASGADDYNPDVEPAVVYTAAILISILTGVYFVLLIFFAKRISIAVRVIQEAAKALAAMPTLVLQPIFTFVALLLLYSWAGVVTAYLASAGEFDPTTGTFTYAGGNCREDMNASVISVSHVASLVSVALPAGVLLRPGAVSYDAGATWRALNGTLAVAHADLRGGECAWDATLFTDRCRSGTNTSSSANFAIAGCLGDAQSSPCVPGEAANLISSAEGEGEGEIVWNATMGMMSFWISEGAVVADALEFAANIYPCTTGGQCASWDISDTLWSCMPLGENQTLPSCWALNISVSVVTTTFTSSYIVSEGEALRSCNLYSNAETATEKLKTAAIKNLENQGKVDVNELEATTWATFPTLENWRGFLPFTFDGNTYNGFVLFHLFMFLWTNQFAISSGYYIVCCAVAIWYWTYERSSVTVHSHGKAAWLFVRYNMGTVIFGSAIIAVVQLVRIVFNYFVNKCEQFKENDVIKFIACIVNCCLWCLEKILGYINRNAYIMSATLGLGFCQAALRAFMLLMRNILRVAAVNAVSAALLFFGHLFIVFLTLAFTYMVSTLYAQSLELLDGPPFLTLFIVFLMSWFVSSAFIGTFEAAVDTVFLSFLHDQEVNDGTYEKPYFMNDALRRAVGVSNKNKVAPANRGES